MIIVFFITAIIYFAVDCICFSKIYNTKMFFRKSGTRLKRYIDLKNKGIKKTVTNKGNYKKIIIIIISLLINLGLILTIFKDVLFSNFVVLDIGYKKIELVSTFENYWKTFKNIYIFLHIIFTIIITNNIIYILQKRNENKSKEAVTKEGVDLGKTSSNNNVHLLDDDLYKNILITGSIGTGKTSGAINTFCEYMIKNEVPGVILDIKGNYVDTVENIAKYYKKEKNIRIISETNKEKYNPLDTNLTAMELANRIRKAIELISPSNNTDSYWLDKVENTLLNLIILIRYYNNQKVDFYEIHKLVTDENCLNTKIEEIKTNMFRKTPTDKEAHEIGNIIMFFSKEFINLDPKILSIIKSEISRITIPFITEYQIFSKFGKSSNNTIKINLKNNTREIIILSINMSKNYMLAKILATFLKLDYQSKALEGIASPIKSFNINDEYQEFANEQDAHFLSLSREAKSINIYSMQSYSSLRNILKNEQATSVIIQNLVNKIWFRSDDNYTVEEILKQLGKEKKILETKAIAEGAQESKISLTGGFINKKASITETVSYSESKDYIFDSTFFSRELKAFEAVVYLSENGAMLNAQKITFNRGYLKYGKE
ncbi:MAG: hypothetical protein PHD20_01335 [Clostridia bacterium]|nr:hypothetical protein [Clostridia bacterium]